MDTTAQLSPAQSSDVLWIGAQADRLTPVETMAQLLRALQRALKEWREQDAAQNWSAFDDARIGNPPVGLIELFETVDTLASRLDQEVQAFQEICAWNRQADVGQRRVPDLCSIARDVVSVAAAINELLRRFGRGFEAECMARERAAVALIAGTARYDLDRGWIVSEQPTTGTVGDAA
jgi:hypothetical protein